MSVSAYMIDVAPWLRLIIAIGAAVIVTVLLVGILHARIVRLNAEPTVDDDGEGNPPSLSNLAGRLIALSTFAFVFLLAFGFSQFWTADKDARQAVTSEASDYARVEALSRQLPADISAPVLTALADYRQSITSVEWPLMQRADTEALAPVHYAAAAAVTEAVYAAEGAGGSKSPVWNELTSQVNSLLSDGLDRANALPDQNAVAIIWLVGILAVANLVFILVFQPAPKRANLVLAGFLAALTAFLMFVLVEVSNPYVGGASVRPSLTATITAGSGR